MNFNCQNEETLILKADGLIRQYYLSDIIYINGTSYLSTIYVNNSDRQDTFSVLVGHLEEKLKPYLFFRINRNVLVNLRYLKQLRQCGGRPRLVLFNDQEFRIAHRRLPDLRRLIMEPAVS
jgi:DNA-binding LytR/AlgR family response regulator